MTLSPRLAGPDRKLADAVLGSAGAAQRRAIAKTITLLESTRADHRARADDLPCAMMLMPFRPNKGAPPYAE